MKLSASPNLDKPPLFNPSHRPIGSETSKPLSFSSFPSPSLHSSSNNSSGTHTSHLGNDFKIPKVENEPYFASDADRPSFKRPKFSEENQHLQQIQSISNRETMDAQLFSPRGMHHVGFSDTLIEDGVAISERDQNSVFISQFNPLNEPSPLGLSLRKSPSLLDLIQRKLTQNEDDGSDGLDQGMKAGRSGNSDKDKLKAANFPASKLRIGTWECTSRYDGDLVAKCYYAKRKLVWEVLDSSLKSKLEVQWSDISGLKAVFPDDQPAILDIELSRPPLFFREINPQPRKHTLWQSTSDFTDGQATICRHHSVQFPAGVLNRHFEKLLQCDARLKALHEQTRIIVDSCFFDNRNMPIDRQHMLHYQSVLSDHATLQPLTMGLEDDHLQHAAAVRSIDGLQSHLTVQGLQNESLKQVASLHSTFDNVKTSFTFDGMKNEPIQRVASSYNDIPPITGVRHRQGGFPLQFSTAASPSSVIDTRGESSSSSENEEAPRKENGKCDNRGDLINLQGSQESSRQFPPIRGSPSHPINEWTAHRQSSVSWEIDSAASSPMMQTPEQQAQQAQQQALNALSLHLLGEPINHTTSHLFHLGRANSQNMQLLGNAGPGRMQPSPFKEPPRELVTKHGNPHNGLLNIEQSRIHTQIRDKHWNPVLENRAMESGLASVAPSLVASHGPSLISSRSPSSVMTSSVMSHAPSAMVSHGLSTLTSHSSYVDLIYLPRIASQPQFLEPGP